jgi:hypothetical protein
MSLESIAEQLNLSKNKFPPVEEWNPPYCGEMDLVIKANGQWLYQGSVFKRLSLVKLLASVLKKEDDDYFLVTPVEKIKIHVEEVPFILTNWQWQDALQTVMQVGTNLDDVFVLDEQHPLSIIDNNYYVTVRRNLLAKVHRNVYYQWVDIAKAVSTPKGTELIFVSANHTFSLGVIA